MSAVPLRHQLGGPPRRRPPQPPRLLPPPLGRGGLPLRRRLRGGRGRLRRRLRGLVLGHVALSRDNVEDIEGGRRGGGGGGDAGSGLPGQQGPQLGHAGDGHVEEGQGGFPGILHLPTSLCHILSIFSHYCPRPWPMPVSYPSVSGSLPWSCSGWNPSGPGSTAASMCTTSPLPPPPTSQRSSQSRGSTGLSTPLVVGRRGEDWRSGNRTCGTGGRASSRGSRKQWIM